MVGSNFIISICMITCVSIVWSKVCSFPTALENHLSCIKCPYIYIYICDPFLGFLFWATSLRVYPYTVMTECLHFCHFVMSLVTSQGLSPSHPLSSMCIELWASKYTLELICQLYSCTHHTHPPDTHMSFKILMQLS